MTKHKLVSTPTDTTTQADDDGDDGRELDSLGQSLAQHGPGGSPIRSGNPFRLFASSGRIREYTVPDRFQPDPGRVRPLPGSPLLPVSRGVNQRVAQHWELLP